ncbi:ATP-binding cassette domain-containing protein [Nocardioides sp.]|uniref:ATP-binding cassette domain-containing protein n=1 Tax=Nocardioides sp. TaxID=35761 RepID=UPI003D152102
MAPTVLLESIARAEGLGHSYAQHDVFSDLTFDLVPGVTGLIGVNGAGKSTLLSIMSTALSPARGTFSLFGADAGSRTRALRRRIGYMPQSLSLPTHLSVTDFLAYMGWLRGIPRRLRPEAIRLALVDADLTSVASSRVGQLSGGMHRRLLFAQALLGHPDLLLLDEPTAGLDPEQRLRLRALVGNLDWARSVVVSSHLMEDLTPIADRVIMLDQQRIAFDGTVGELNEIGRETSHDAGVSVYEAAFMALRAHQAPR